MHTRVAKLTQETSIKKINGNVKKILDDKGVLHIITTRGYYLLDVTKPNYKLDSIAIPNITSQGPHRRRVFDEDGNL